jgi:processive 1,2-diacylglycerol beta-glucosyltransferase
VVLVTAGAFGLLPDFAAAVQALREGTQAHLVVVAGRDRQWYERLAALQDEATGLTVLAYTTAMPALMAAADVLVSKAGGMTMAEALVSGLPMVVYRPIPGQEAENARYLKDEGAARIAEDVVSLAAAVRELVARPALREAMAARARRLGRPGAARTIAAAVAELAREAGRRSALGREG